MNKGRPENYRDINIEDTAKLLTQAGSAARKKRTVLLIAALAAVLIIAVAAGYFAMGNKKYNDQISIAEKSLTEGNYEQAEADYLAAMDMKPRKPQAREGLAYVYAAEGRYDESAEIYTALYEDTKEDKYLAAADWVAGGRLPYDPDIVPAHGIWRSVGVSNIPYDTVLKDLMYPLWYHSYEWYDNDRKFDCKDLAGDHIMSFLMTGYGPFGIAVEDVQEDQDLFDREWEHQMDGMDPRGWGEYDDAYDLYGGYVIYDKDKVDWIITNIFNLTEDDITAMLEQGSADHQIYSQDGDYYCVNGWWTGAPEGLSIEFTDVLTDGQKYCIQFDAGYALIDDDEYYYDEDPELDRSQEYDTLYIMAELKPIDGKHYWSIYYIGPDKPEEISADTVAADDTESDNSGNAGDTEIFRELEGVEFIFASGAGAWDTEMSIGADGSFAGEYHDSDMGDTGDGYPDGTVYHCTFHGKFGEARKVSDHEYRFKLLTIETEDAVDTESIENGVRYIAKGPYGLENAEEIALYLPGTPASELPEEFLNWMYGVASEEEYKPTLTLYGLYNINEEQGFAGR